MRQNRANDCGSRSNALWGRGSRGESRSNALWGRGGRRAGVAVATMALTLATMAAFAVAKDGNSSGGNHNGLKAYVEDSLLAGVQANPKASFDVILQGDRNGKTSGFLTKVLSDTSGSADEHMSAANVRQQFSAINGVEASLSGKVILHLAKQGLVTSILANEPVQGSAVNLPVYSTQLWPWTINAAVDWTAGSPKAPTIAVVDSGIDPSHTADFGNRLLGQVNMVSGATGNSSGDGYGHGTFVAGIAAGAAPGYAGVAPKANLLSVDVMNDQGMASVADVIKACGWILANKSTYNIQVANFSLHSVNKASVLFDPLDQAVEKLWLNGVVVVAASGNYATDAQNTPSGVNFAPGNDPFVITVGATDIGAAIGSSDDSVAPWSAWGYTGDGFMKPDIGAPGRYMVGPVPAGGILAQQRADHVVAPGYMQLSGTSFAAPVVAGAAAMIRAQHPTWTPDQVKGALMVTATPEPNVIKGALGVGEVDIVKSRTFNKVTLPNPNAGLDQFIAKATDGSSVFNAAAWQSAAKSNAAWNSAAWSDAAWSDAAWASAAWSDAAWSDAAWASAAWGSAAWSDAAWSDAAWSDAAWADGSSTETDGTTADTDPSLEAALLANLGIVDPTCDPTLDLCDAVTNTSSGLGSLLP